MQDQIQKELDLVEEYILTCLFENPNNPQINNGLNVFLTIRGINYKERINNYLTLFETFMRPLMHDNGTVNGARFLEVVSGFIPNISIPSIIMSDFRLIDWAKKFEKPLQLIGQLIR